MRCCAARGDGLGYHRPARAGNRQPADPRDSPLNFTVTIPWASAAYAGLHMAACDPGCAAALAAVAGAERRLSRALRRHMRIAEMTQRRSRVALAIYA